MKVCLTHSHLVCVIFLVSIIITRTSSNIDIGVSDIIECSENLDITIFKEVRENISHEGGSFPIHMRSWECPIGFGILKSGNLLDADRLRRILNFASERPTLTVIYFESITSFHTVSKEITEFLDGIPLPIWSPTFILNWPIVSTTFGESEELFRNGTFKSMGDRLDLKSNVYILISTNNNTFSLWEIYTISHMYFYHCLGTELVNFVNLTNKISRRSNFNGAEVSAVAANDPVFAMETKFTADLKSFESGAAVNRFWFLRDSLNFSEVPVLGPWTYENSYGQLVGSGVDIVAGKIDLGIAQAPMTLGKKKFIDYLQPTNDIALKIFFVQPKASRSRDIHRAAFEPKLWLVFGLSWIILIIIIRFNVWFKSWILCGNYNCADDVKFGKDFLIWAVATVSQIGWYRLPSSYSIRIVHLVSHVTAFLSLTAFTASIVVFLTLKSSPIKSVNDITNSSFKIYSNPESTPVIYVLPILKSQKGYPEKILVNESFTILEAMKGGGAIIAFAYVFALMAESLSLSDSEMCNKFNSFPVLQARLMHGMIVRKGSPFREFFNHKLILMTERGSNHRFKVAYAKGTELSCLDYSLTRHESLEIADLKSVYVILLIGLSSLFFFFIEILYEKIRFHSDLNLKQNQDYN